MVCALRLILKGQWAACWWGHILSFSTYKNWTTCISIFHSGTSLSIYKYILIMEFHLWKFWHELHIIFQTQTIGFSSSWWCIYLHCSFIPCIWFELRTQHGTEMGLYHCASLLVWCQAIYRMYRKVQGQVLLVYSWISV